MKFCAVICEYNPFHNGHAYQLDFIRRHSGCDKIICLMSGNFTQRGEAAVFHKYTRARHAIEGGADVVLELPAAFSVAPAELFARGAVHVLASIPAVKALAFGCESGGKEDFFTYARATSEEDKTFKATLKSNLKSGDSYIRARNAALLALHPELDDALLSSPNNILGIEYCRAILAENSAIEPLPIPRIGSGHGETKVLKNYSSASALRELLGNPARAAKKALKGNLPEGVFEDVSSYRPTAYAQAAMCALLSSREEAIARTPDCAEGLENRLLSMARSNPNYDDLLKKTVSKRYTLSRIRRVIAQNFLGISLGNVKSYLEGALYYKVLAVKKEGAEEILAELKGAFPAIVRKSDYSLLKKDALECFRLDVHANDLYAALTGNYVNEFQTLFV